MKIQECFLALFFVAVIIGFALPIYFGVKMQFSVVNENWLDLFYNSSQCLNEEI